MRVCWLFEGGLGPTVGGVPTDYRRGPGWAPELGAARDTRDSRAAEPPPPARGPHPGWLPLRALGGRWGRPGAGPGGADAAPREARDPLPLAAAPPLPPWYRGRGVRGPGSSESEPDPPGGGGRKPSARDPVPLKNIIKNTPAGCQDLKYKSTRSGVVASHLFARVFSLEALQDPGVIRWVSFALETPEFVSPARFLAGLRTWGAMSQALG